MAMAILRLSMNAVPKTKMNRVSSSTRRSLTSETTTSALRAPIVGAKPNCSHRLYGTLPIRYGARVTDTRSVRSKVKGRRPSSLA